MNRPIWEFHTAEPLWKDLGIIVTISVLHRLRSCVVSVGIIGRHDRDLYVYVLYICGREPNNALALLGSRIVGSVYKPGCLLLLLFFNQIFVLRDSSADSREILRGDRKILQ